jgi:hypothetical protein
MRHPPLKLPNGEKAEAQSHSIIYIEQTTLNETGKRDDISDKEYPRKLVLVKPLNKAINDMGNPLTLKRPLHCHRVSPEPTSQTIGK